MTRDRQNSDTKRRIAVVAPARALDPVVARKLSSLAAQIAPTLDIQFDPQCFAAAGHFAGDDVTRQDALVKAANDPEVDAVWFARGGYGSIRLLRGLKERLGPAARDKTYLGYSDTGALLALLYDAKIGRSVHGPMPSDLSRKGGEAAIQRALDSLSASIAPPSGDTPELAFNLTTLAAINGTPFMPDLSGHILHLEDIGEYHYRLDRAFAQLALSNWFSKLAGVRLGRFSEILENDIDFVDTAEAIARRWCAEVGVPVLGASPIGHDTENGILAFG
ncbi:MAG: LD-carboxypeptidase [Pseudomonadota bacterium]